MFVVLNASGVAVAPFDDVTLALPFSRRLGPGSKVVRKSDGRVIAQTSSGAQDKTKAERVRR